MFERREIEMVTAVDRARGGNSLCYFHLRRRRVPLSKAAQIARTLPLRYAIAYLRSASDFSAFLLYKGLHFYPIIVVDPPFFILAFPYFSVSCSPFILLCNSDAFARHVKA